MRREELGGLRQLPDDVSAADWIVAAVRNFDHTVGSLVPPVFEAYARVLHPAARREDSGDGGAGGAGLEVEVSWAQVAAANGRQAHAGMEWVAITGSWSYRHGESQPGIWDGEPREGSLPAAQGEALVAVLARFTTRAEDCFFAVWEGYGSLALAPVAATVPMPQREMLLVSGPLSQAGWASMETAAWEQSPSLWWPADRAWCVATDVDLMSTYVGGSRACIDAVLAAPGLEAWEVPDGQGVTWDSDGVNPVPPRPE
ncbi:hypothetical protein [Kineococcus sp. SYSU DK006]|uniref:hypothetical protein n=1 Tax=Kineococcus sp. SYSU DK006 TaxID=3383127 RepID=UPI003D7EEF74